MENYFRPAVIFAGCLIAVLSVIPIIGIIEPTGFLFFSPQYVFPYHGFVVREKYHSVGVFSHETGTILNWLQWVIAGLGFVWFEHRMSWRRQLRDAVISIVVITVVVNLAFSLFEIYVELDAL